MRACLRLIAHPALHSLADGLCLPALAAGGSRRLARRRLSGAASAAQPSGLNGRGSSERSSSERGSSERGRICCVLAANPVHVYMLLLYLAANPVNVCCISC